MDSIEVMDDCKLFIIFKCYILKEIMKSSLFSLMFISKIYRRLYKNYVTHITCFIL
jgi:hypothetical protein